MMIKFSCTFKVEGQFFRSIFLRCKNLLEKCSNLFFFILTVPFMDVRLYLKAGEWLLCRYCVILVSSKPLYRHFEMRSVVIERIVNNLLLI